MTRFLKPHPGPEYAPSSASGCGLWSTTCWRYELPGTLSEATWFAWPVDLSEQAIEPDTILEWATFPAFDTDAELPSDGFRSCGTALEVEFTDGTLLAAVSEYDGLPSDAAARSRIDLPDQWNLRRVALSSHAGRIIKSLRLHVSPAPPAGTVGSMLVGWVDGPRLTTGGQLPDARADRVMTTRGSHSSPDRSRGLTQPLAGMPHGACHIAPATDLGNSHWTYSWSAHGSGPHPVLRGLLLTRAPSIWIGDRGAIGFTFGHSLDASGVASEPFRHDDEQARPHC